MWDMFNRYPYINLTDRNLDLLTKAIREMQNEVKNFVSINAVKYANPIQWSINRQYEKNTIVIDPLTGTAFISVQPVPSGVALTRTEYWTVVFDLSQFVTKAASNFANSYERDITTTATMATGAGDWVVWDSTLYVALNAIHAGDAYVVGGNIKRMTVEDFYDLLMDAIHNLDEELDTEIRNRTNADDTLQDNIDAEALVRQQADGTLQHNIDAEALARQQADGTLQHNIDAEALARQQVDGVLRDDIDAEVLARQGDVVRLENLIQANSGHLYKTISDMVNDTNLVEGQIGICVYPAESHWEVVAQESETLTSRRLSNGLNARLLADIPIKINALRDYNSGDDISSDVAFLLCNGYQHLIIPKGVYRCAVSVGANSIIEGAGKQMTSLIPSNHGATFAVDGDNVTIKNLSIQDVSPFTGYGITVTHSLGSSNSHFENLHIENVKEGFLATSTMIWCEFSNCDFIGCMDNGFIVTSAEAFFNNNAFYSCKFNNNVNSGVVIDVTEVHDYATAFYSCNIEYNAHDRFGVAHVSPNAVKNAGFTTFNNCYFEGNGSTNSDATIQNFDLLNLEGCVFVQDRILVDNTNPSITNFIGCKQYQCIGYTTSSSNVNTLGNNFSV